MNALPSNITALAVYSNRVAGASDRDSRENGGLTSGCAGRAWCAGRQLLSFFHPRLMGLTQRKQAGVGCRGGSGRTLRGVLAGGASFNVLRSQWHADDPYGPQTEAAYTHKIDVGLW